MSVGPLDLENGDVKEKSDKKLKPTGDAKLSQQWNCGKLNPTLLVIVPLIVFIEIAMNYNMLIIPPDHPVHISTYCAQCGIDIGTTFADIGTNYDEYTKASIAACMEDGILGLVGDAFTVFNGNYMATLLGHILTTYALLASLDADMVGNDSMSRANVLHASGYVLLLVDVVVEFALLIEVASHDPNTIDVMQEGNYVACDNTLVVETKEAKKILLFAAWEMIIWRAIVAVIISLIYIVNMSKPEVDDVGEENGKDK